MSISPPLPDNLTDERNKGLRGGRLRRTARGVVSFAPFVVFAAFAMPAAAQEAGCMGSVAAGWACTGVTDSTVNITAGAGEAITVTSSDNFGLAVPEGPSGSATQNGIVIRSGTLPVTVSGGIDIRLTGSGEIMTVRGNGVDINHIGRDNVYVNIQQNIRTGLTGFRFTNSGVGEDVEVRLADVSSGTHGCCRSPGVYLSNAGHATILETGAVTSADSAAIRINHSGGGQNEKHPVTVTTNGAVESGGDSLATSTHGIDIQAFSGTSDITITANGTITSKRGGHGIEIDQDGVGDVRVTTNGGISANGRGINIETAAASAGVFVAAMESVTGANEGINVAHMGVGNVEIRTRGAVSAVGEEAINITTAADSGGITVEAGDNLNAGKDGIKVNHQGSGALMITTAADAKITAAATGAKGVDITTAGTATGLASLMIDGGIEAGGEGINVDHDGTGELVITTGGTITSTAERGIFAGTASETTGDVRIITNGTIMAGKEGIYLQHNGSGDVHIATNGDVAPTEGEEGIVVVANSASTGDVTININGDVVIDSDRTTNSAVFVNNGSGTTRINISEGTVASSSGTAIDVLGAADAIVTLNDGASLNADFDASNSFDGTATLVLAGVDTTGDNSFQLSHVLSVDNLEKNGTGTWTLMEEQDTGESFTNFDINEGRIVWDATSALLATRVSIADGATLEISDSQTWETSLTLSGVLDLAGSDSNLTLDTLAGSGGSVDINVNFSNGDGDIGTPRLNVTTVSGGPIIVNVTAVGGFPEIPEDDEDEAITIGNLISTENAEDGDFVAGRSINGNFDFDFAYDAASNQWDLVARQAGGNIEDALFETLPAALSQLASLESYQRRIQGRAFARGDNRIYGKVSRSSSEVEPNSTNFATYDLDNTSVRFGVELPLRINHPRIADNFTVGANIDFGQAATDVSVEENKGKISTDSVNAAINATWQGDEGIYLDGQLLYATSKNDIKTDINLGSTDAAAYSLGAEIGWGLELEGFLVMPSAQIAWTEVDVEDFTSAAGDVMTIDDGNVLNGRIGVAVEREWRGILPEDVLLRGHADLLAPLEGEVIASVDGMKMLSERKEPSVNIGIGASYAWDGLGISADVSTQQGGETEGYAGTLGFKYEF